jgi:hypothetical protein
VQPSREGGQPIARAASPSTHLDELFLWRRKEGALPAHQNVHLRARSWPFQVRPHTGKRGLHKGQPGLQHEAVEEARERGQQLQLAARRGVERADCVALGLDLATVQV